MAVTLCKKCGAFVIYIDETANCEICGHELTFPPITHKQFYEMSSLETDAYRFKIQSADKYDSEAWEKSKLEESIRWCEAAGMVVMKREEAQAKAKKDDERGLFFGINFPL